MTAQLALASLVDASVVMALSIAVAASRWRRSAAVRHWIVAAGMLAALAAPALESIAPRWHLPARPAEYAPVSGTSLRIDVDSSSSAAPTVMRSPVRTDRLAIARRLLWTTWAFGTSVALAILLAGLARLTWLAARAEPVSDGPWRDVADELTARIGLRRPVEILQSDHPSLLVTWGWTAPKIILPSAARTWTSERARIILSHELAHILRRDWATHMLAELTRAAYWFNPLAWIAANRLRQESEEACDDAVVLSGVDAVEYAAHLLDLARTLARDPRLRFAHPPAPAIARPSSLERRISAMLHARSDRSPLARRTRAAIVAVVLLLACVIAGFTASAQGAGATFSGSLLDQVGRTLPDATLTMTNVATSETRELHSDQTGHFSLSGLAAGEYLLQVRIPGFAITQGRVTLGAGQTLQRDIALQVGSVEETVWVTPDTTPASPPAVTAAGTSGLSAPQQAPVSAAINENAPPDPCSQSAAGGCIRPPVRISNTRPIYPASLQGSNVEGTIIVDGRLGTDGFVKDMRVEAPVQQDLARAAVEAVGRWRFRPTQLDGVPIEVPITVHVHFSSPK